MISSLLNIGNPELIMSACSVVGVAYIVATLIFPERNL